MSDITVGSVAVSVVPDARQFREKLAAQLRNLTAEITINADLAHLREQLAEATRSRPVTVNVDADTAGAEAKIAEVARDRRAEIHLGVDQGGLSAASSSLGGISGFGAAIVALGPALVPVLAAVAGLVGALAAPLAFAGGGLTLFGLLAGFAVKGTKEQIKQLGVLTKKVDADRLALAKASTPSGKKSAALQLAADTKSYQLALAALTPAQKRFMGAQDKLKESFHKLVVAAGGAIFGPLIKGMNLLSGILPKLAPAIRPIADGIGALLDDVGKAAKGPAFKDFVKFFGTSARGAIVSFGRIFENVSKGLFNLFQAFSPASKGLVGAIGNMAKAFADFDFSKSKSFQSFLGYVRDVGPKVADVFGHLIQAFANLAPVLVPLGAAWLALADGLAKFIANADPTTLAIIATAVGGIALAFGAVNPATLLAFGAGLAFLVSKSKPLNKAFGELSGWVRDKLMPALSDAAKKDIPALKSAFDSVKQSVKDNHGLFKALGTIIGATGTFITTALIPALATLYSVELPLLGKAIGLGITSLRILGIAWTLMALAGVVSLRLLVGAALSTFGAILAAADIGLGWLPDIGKKIHKARVAFGAFKDGTIAALDKTAAKLLALQSTLNNIVPPKPITLKIRLALDSSNKTALALLGLMGPGPSNKTKGLIAGRATGGPVAAHTPYWVGERGRPELFVPDQAGHIDPNPTMGGGHTGPMVNIENMTPMNYGEFLRETQQRARHAALSGRR